MIAYLRGICQAIDGDALVVDVRGVGYLVAVPEPDRLAHSVGGDVELLVHTEVREDAIALYGFGTASARDLFRCLLSVPGVGPKAALALLSELEPVRLAAAIVGGQAQTLCKAKGIGKKTAETIVVKLRDRLPPIAGTAVRPAVATGPAPAGLVADLESALINLGYKPNAAASVAQATAAAQPAASLDVALRAALASLRRPA